jgi:hypothetical protein
MRWIIADSARHAITSNTLSPLDDYLELKLCCKMSTSGSRPTDPRPAYGSGRSALIDDRHCAHRTDLWRASVTHSTVRLGNT